MSRVFHDTQGDEQQDRRRPVAQRTLPPWVDYTVIAGLLSVAFFQGIQANKVETISKQLETHTVQLSTIIASDSKSDVAVLKEHSHAQDQALSDLKDAILRRLDKIDARMEQVRGNQNR